MYLVFYVDYYFQKMLVFVQEKHVELEFRVEHQNSKIKVFVVVQCPEKHELLVDHQHFAEQLFVEQLHLGIGITVT